MNKKTKSKCFDCGYSNYYDIFYECKNYKAEAAYIHKLIQKYYQGASNIRDIACGTGNHLIELLKYGYNIDCSDLSAEMLDILKKKLLNYPQFHGRITNENMISATSKNKYDAVICMFAAINYLNGWREINKFLINLKKILKTGGLFIFDCWNGVAVPNYFSKTGEKIFKKDNIKIIRNSETEIDKITQKCRIDYDISLFKYGKKIGATRETHNLFYFSPVEIETLLVLNGFEIISLTPFMKNRKIRQDDWEFMTVSRKK